MTNDVISRVKSVTRETYDKRSKTSTFHELTPEEYLIEVCDYMYYRYFVHSKSVTQLHFKTSFLWQGKYLARVSQSNGIIIRYTINA